MGPKLRFLCGVLVAIAAIWMISLATRNPQEALARTAGTNTQATSPSAIMWRPLFNEVPAGAVARCNDRTYSFAARGEDCVQHGGVAYSL